MMRAAGARGALAKWTQKINLLLNGNHVDGAANAVEQMIQQNVSVSPAFLSDVLKALAQRGDRDAAVSLFGKCEQQGTQPDVSCFSAVIWAHRKTSPPDPVGAYAYLQKMEVARFSPTCGIYNQVIGAYCDASQPIQGLEVLNRMQACAVSFDIYSFGNIIRSYSRLNDTENAVAVFARAEAARLQPDRICYESIIDAFSRMGDISNVRAWQERATQHHVCLGDEKELVEKSFEQKNVSAETKKCFCSSLSSNEKMFAQSSPASFSERICSSGASGSTGRAVQLTDERIEKAIESQDTTAACRYLFEMCSSSSTMPAPALLASVLKLVARKGDVATCFQLVEACQNIGTRMNAASYTALIAAHRRRKPPDAAGALRFLDEMVSKGFKPNCSTYNSVICAFAERDDASSAEALLQRMSSSGVVPDLFNYSAVIHAHAKQGDSDSASRIFEDALRQNLIPDLVCFNAVADSFAKRADPSGAVRWLERAKSNGLHPDIVSHNIVLSAFANNLDPKGAVNFFHKMLASRFDVCAMSYNSVIAAHAQVGDIFGAARWFGRMTHKNVQPTSVSYSSVITACAKAGNEDMCLFFMRRLLRSGIAIKEVSVFNALLGVFCIVDRPDVQKFMYWFHKISEHELDPDVITYNLLINLHAKCGEPDIAAEHLENLLARNIDPGVHCFGAVVDAYARQKNDRMVAYWARRMQEFGTKPDAITFHGAVERHKYPQTVEHEGAFQSC